MLYKGEVLNKARLGGPRTAWLKKRCRRKTNISPIPHLVQGPPDTAPPFPAVLLNFQLCPLPDYASGFAQELWIRNTS